MRRLHAEVDAEVGRLSALHAARLHCRKGCAACCVDRLTVFEVEADRIRSAHADLLSEGEPHAPGACAFLDAEDACRIYADRPYVCRTQGLPLRFLLEGAGGTIEERRDICPLNHAGATLSSLPEEECWLLGPVEDRLRRLQEARDDGEGRRVSLRSLFARSSPA